MSLNDIIPVDVLFGEPSKHGSKKNKKKVDRIALASPLMRIPKMDVQVARDLIDIGINELYELEGRAAESLFDEIKKIRPDTPLYRMAHIRMAIYFSENDDPDPKKLHPSEWEE